MNNALADTEVEFIFQKDGTNDTVVLYGELDGLFNVDNFTGQPPAPEPTQYDGQGALMFVVAVIVVYSLSMFFIVATLLRRKSSKQSLDGQVNQYIKGLEAAREQDKMEQVLRTRLRWPGNFIHFGFESYSASEVDPRSDRDSNIDSDNVTSSDESFIEIPATTLSLDHPNITSSFDKDKEDAKDDECNLPPVYAIPEFLRRTRRHRMGDSSSRPTSLSKSLSQTEESECLTQVPVVVCAYVDEDSDTDASDAGKVGNRQQIKNNPQLKRDREHQFKSPPANATGKKRTVKQDVARGKRSRQVGQDRRRDMPQNARQDSGRGLDRARHKEQDIELGTGQVAGRRRSRERHMGEDMQQNMEQDSVQDSHGEDRGQPKEQEVEQDTGAEVGWDMGGTEGRGQYIALASFDSTPSSSINFSDTCA